MYGDLENRLVEWTLSDAWSDPQPYSGNGPRGSATQRISGGVWCVAENAVSGEIS